MKVRSIVGACALVFVIFGTLSAVTAQSGYKISAPHTYKNLTIFLLHGKDEARGKNVLTLQEAMERKLFFVYETSDVNELEVENRSKQFDVFIQSGDIVKGGKQDRVLAVSIIIPAGSGRVKIEAFCVESGRWKKRGEEDASKFDSSSDRIVSKELKLAANGARSQQEVWNQVSEAQAKLGRNVGSSVAAEASKSSLQLSLENKKVVATVDEYIKNLSNVVNGETDVIGYAFAINGKINSADIYVSNALFKKVWLKMLKASAIEAVSESRSVRLADPVKAAAVRDLIDDAEKARPKEQSMGSGARLITREDKDNVMFESRDAKSKAVIHKSYVRKQ